MIRSLRFGASRYPNTDRSDVNISRIVFSLVIIFL